MNSQVFTPNKRKSSGLMNIRSIWRLRYRMYALLVMVVLMPILYASNSGIPPQVDVIGYNTVSSNALFDIIEKQIIRISTNTPASTPEEQEQKVTETDDLNQNLRLAGYNLGYINSDAYVDLSTPTSPSSPVQTAQTPQPVTLDDLVPRPVNPQRVNFLRYPKYNINAPVIYSSLGDLFNTKPNCDPATDSTQCLDFGSPRDNSPTDSPIQLKLQQGIVHIAFTPLPGETGNSYIIGHSSNYSWVPSAYNAVFKPLERRSVPGEEFFIYDRFGRELKFRVFETLEILETDTATAYKNYPDKRVVTLQTSILEFVPGQGFLPTKRWLTRGELVIE